MNNLIGVALGGKTKVLRKCMGNFLASERSMVGRMVQKWTEEPIVSELS